MNIEKLFNGKAYADKEDFKREFNCGTDKAISIIRAIKSISNIANIKGRVVETDVILWLNLPLNKVNNE